ncbi:MAG TPA: SBBP repeat-containing protein [Myxococcota bacterium]|nr:SBBP repeat-containing protein [Myxococcota bacterium]
MKRPNNPPPANTTVVNFSTYLGDDLADVVRDVVLDSAGNAYVVGGALSVDLLDGAPVRAHGGSEDAFVAKFNTAGQVVWWTFLGGAGPDRGYAIDLAPGDEVVIGGSAAAGFPVTAGAVLETFQGGAGACDPNQLPSGTPAGAVCVPSTTDPARDGFVAKLDANGALLWATYFGSGTFEADTYIDDTSTANDDNVTDFNDDLDPRTSVVRDVAVDPNGGEIYLTFSVRSPSAFFPDPDPDIDPDTDGNQDGPLEPAAIRNLPPVILTALQAGDRSVQPSMDSQGLAGRIDGLLAKLAPDGASLLWATYVGGTGDESTAGFVRLDSQGNPIVLFHTDSVQRIEAQDPDTKEVLETEDIAQGGFDTEFGGGTDFFLAKFGMDGPMIWSTYMGGSGVEAIDSAGFALQSDDSIVIAGFASSSDFNPNDGDPFDPTFNGSDNGGFFSADCGIAKIAPDAAELEATTLYGGGQGDACTGVDVDDQDRIYVTGGTHSPDLPIAGGPHQFELPGARSAFLAVFTPDLMDLLAGGYFGGTGFGNANALVLRSTTATSATIVFAGESEAGYPLSASPARETVTAPPAHGVLSDVTLDLSTP